MFDSLARLADGHARRVGLAAIAFFLIAGTLGGSVASRLDPYGADDPSTEAVKAVPFGSRLVRTIGSSANRATSVGASAVQISPPH